MSLEDSIERLKKSIDELTGMINEFLELKNPSIIYEETDDDLQEKIVSAKGSPYSQGPSEAGEEEEKVEGANPKVIQLINLAKKMGETYIYQDGRLVVDNRVLDEFNRRALPNRLG